MIKKPNGQSLFCDAVAGGALSLLVKNGRVIDPVNSIDEVMHVLCNEGKIVSVSKDMPDTFAPDRVIDAQGLWVLPGLTDMHVHLREPGQEKKETIQSGLQAAAAGGFTSVACMPNTNPALDNEAGVRYVIEQSSNAPCRVYPVGAITKNRAGKEIASFSQMIHAGAKAFSDDGCSVYRADVMRNAFHASQQLGVALLCHCEDPDLASDGHMNEGAASYRLGIKGIPSVSEEIIVARDILLAEYCKAAVHICHISTAGCVELIRWAKKRGVKVTAETCPHYLVYVDEDVKSRCTNKKMNPPLRTARDRDALLAGLADGTIDVIASDHAPHTIDEKNAAFDAAAFGIVGLETMLGVVLSFVVHKGIVNPSQMVNLLSVTPNRILKLDGGSLTPGSDADITIADPHAQWTVDSSCFYSKSRNTPFEGMKLTGYAKYTISGGRIVYERQ